MNTPETDKAERMAYSGEYMVPTEFARQLEHERDEALRHLEEIKEYGTEEINAAVELRQKLAAALIERDEAIRQRDETNTSSKYACDYNYEQKLKAERERDGAREEAERLRESLRCLLNPQCEAEESK